MMRILSQFAALYGKNALVAWRARRATILRVAAPFFFLLLALLIDRALQANDSNSSAFSDVKRPDSESIADIPSCHDDIYIGSKACMEIAYSPNNTIANQIIGNVTARNSKSITAMGFASRDAVQDFLLANPDYMIAAVHFIFDRDFAPNPNLQGFVIQTNTTAKSFKATVQDPNKFVQLPLQSAVHREIARFQLRSNPDPSLRSLADTLSWYIGLKAFAHPTIATVSVLGQVLGPFIFAACMFSFVTQIGTVVMEKEQGLRQALRTMGMTDGAYWASWGAWEVTLAFITGHLITIFGLILQFNLFLHNSYGLLFFLFFLFQLAMSSLALLCAAFISRTQTAVYLGFVIFIGGWVMQTVVIFGVPFTPNYWLTTPLSKAITVIFSVLPWDLLVKGFNDLGAATINGDSPGIRWSERSWYCQNIQNVNDQSAWSQANHYDPGSQYVSFNCVMPLDTIYRVFIALWIGFFVLAIYLDNIIKNEFGVRRPLLYFLYPSYWVPTVTAPAAALKHVLDEDSKGPEVVEEKDEDVLAEESRMRSLLNHRTGKEGELAAAVDRRNAIEVFGLKKRYGGSQGCCGHSVVCCSICDCCSCLNVPSFWPIKGSWFGIEENSLFCLLGPNGAGKTTTINCLTGALPPTYGDALVYGQSIRSTGGMDKIRSLMGVCPQFDVLWPELSGREHLLLYGRIKGHKSWKGIREEADTLLEKVKLTYAADQRTGAYSGGMRRRLSVAIALLGDPKVVYLDEPTTGMDPISRRYVWDIIQEAKVGRAIVLTTHSMEEADILGDRIAIMALGRLRCIGSSLRLKQRFGAGYQVAVSVQPPRAEQADVAALDKRLEGVLAYFKAHLGLEPSEQGRVYTSFLVPREREHDLIAFLAKLESDQASLGITDIQLSLTSLEEVFLTIARKAALEAAQSSASSPSGAKKKDLPFCSTCLKVTLLAATLPLSVFLVPWWGRFLVGRPKEESGSNTVQLPDGTYLTVTPGQEFVPDSSGATYRIVWGVDESGNLIAQEARPAGLQQHLQAAGSGQAMPIAVAENGRARLPMAGNVLLEVAVGASWVMNPLNQRTYSVQWGKDGLGRDVVLSVAAVAPQAPYPADPSSGLPVATPLVKVGSQTYDNGVAPPSPKAAALPPVAGSPGASYDGRPLPPGSSSRPSSGHTSNGRR